MHRFTNDNFEQCLSQPDKFLDLEDAALNDAEMIDEIVADPLRLIDRTKDPIQTSDEDLKGLGEVLKDVFYTHYSEIFGKDGDLCVEDYFRDVDMWRILNNVNLIHNEDDLQWLLGGDILVGGVHKLFLSLQCWKQSPTAIEREERMAVRKAIAAQVYRETIERLEKQNTQRLQADQLAKIRLEQKAIKLAKRVEEARLAKIRLDKAKYARESNSRAMHWLKNEKVPIELISEKEELYLAEQANRIAE
ncbi:uncharacterized protein MELLADRAFT_93249 [Melampsora larici-populina 98AG31]|uniref:Uncharacterized protein n=1 Tax=Melampsora larici-populina (strain 98AG31 / pathotype 3-4-7) TaxID=747676 RepID=F4S4H2_MELLP|nr:uncharacterized protein MELLADRAFT_93249 [Melampsora larici-populina 98AG31]EGG00409.1 hypothetical protein MELLADRAFT_93249 [Melampsora larici-populina 98AG31]